MAKQPATSQSKPKHGWLKWFFGTLLVLGAIAFFAPMIYEAQQSNLRIKTASSYRRRLYPADEKRDELIRQYNANALATQQGRTKPYGKTTIEQILGKNAKLPVGYINIPAIDLKAMPIYYGTSDEILSKGTGIMPFTSLPAPGKYVTSSVTGHTGVANRIFFDNIRYLKKGDVFIIDVFAHRMGYQVIGRKVIDPLKRDATTNFYVKGAQNRAILMTCTPIGINDHRLLIYGKRVPLKTAEDHRTIPRDAFSPMNLWRDAIILLLIFVLLWWLYYWLQDRKQRRQAKAESEAQS
ncbi:class C sortase [Lacticaseibacillus hegangensis]|uniref:Class C sortase n=2 Tax=Lacticaseibacillus hegangensis TaxID=2486010 RepID=A0ABW4D0V6_9LACO